MASNGITLNSYEFRKAVEQVADKTGVSAADVLRDQMRLLVQTLYKWTPPPKKSAGVNRVKADLAKLFTPYLDESILQDYLDEMDERGANLVYRTDSKGNLYTIKRDQIVLDPITMREVHQQHRDRRGRVRNIGRSSKYLVPLKMFRKYVKEVTKHVGKLRAGWMPAMALFNARSAPSWVADNRAFGMLHGEASDRLNNDLKGMLVAENRVPYIRDEGMLTRAMRLRTKDLEKNLDKRVDQIMRKHSA
jgi:hypothetical protein